jgi:hypothetical protein
MYRMTVYLSADPNPYSHKNHDTTHKYSTPVDDEASDRLPGHNLDIVPWNGPRVLPAATRPLIHHVDPRPEHSLVRISLHSSHEQSPRVWVEVGTT